MTKSLEITKEGVKVSYRLFLTDLATGLAVLYLIGTHLSHFLPIELNSTHTLVLFLVCSAPIGIVLSSISLVLLSLHFF